MRTKKSALAIPALPNYEPLLLTTSAAAELLSVSPWEIRRLCRKGQLAYKKLSKTNWLVTFKSVKTFAEVRA